MNEIIEAHFLDPKNVGTLMNPNAHISVGNAVCGDLLKMDVDFNQARTIQAVAYKAYGCSTSLATASIISEFIQGKPLADLSKVTREEIVGMLGELEPKERHCIEYALDILAELAKLAESGNAS